jgi:hypothetical protein
MASILALDAGRKHLSMKPSDLIQGVRRRADP